MKQASSPITRYWPCVRLEGCIIKLLLFASLKHREVTIELAREALSDQIKAQDGDAAAADRRAGASIDRVQLCQIETEGLKNGRKPILLRHLPGVMRGSWAGPLGARWSFSDRIRDGLAGLGIALEDKKDGTSWKRVE